MGRAAHPLPLDSPEPDELFELRVQAVTQEIQRGPRTPWTGPVIRRDPAVVRQQSEVLIMRCPNTACRHWLRKPTPGKPTRCKVCQETAVYLDVLAAEALAEHRSSRCRG